MQTGRVSQAAVRTGEYGYSEVATNPGGTKK